ncbi:MAG: hypothetical protein OXN89_22720 [Bryobacterales bacterium]|nr:hypothetical protein [Bryobacterales bacterium]
MALRWTALVGLLLLLAPVAAQRPGGRQPLGREPEVTMPDGRSRTLMILKSDAEKSSDDMERVVELATELQEEIERNEFHTVDLRSIRKAEEIIKLVRRVKGRLSRMR